MLKLNLKVFILYLLKMNVGGEPERGEGVEGDPVEGEAIQPEPLEAEPLEPQGLEPEPLQAEPHGEHTVGTSDRVAHVDSWSDSGLMEVLKRVSMVFMMND